MQETFEKNIEASEQIGLLSKNTLKNELLPDGEPKKKKNEKTDNEDNIADLSREEIAGKIEEERKELPGIKILEVSKKKPNIIKFEYEDSYIMTYEALYDKDIIHVSDKNGANPREYTFQFIFSLFKEDLTEHSTKNHVNNLMRRLAFCIKAKEMISQKLDAEGMMLETKTLQYIRGGEAYKENTVYFVVERLKKKGDVGYKKDKEEHVTQYLMLNTETGKIVLSNPAAFALQSKVVNTTLED